MLNISKYVLIFFITLLLSCNEEKINVDILIENGIVYDGISKTSNNNSIGVKGDKIVYFGNEADVDLIASKIIDAEGLIVAPGFIDPHTHADRDLINPETSHNKPFLFQGITTVVIGNDGSSYFPSSKYIKKYEEHGIGTNVALLVGQGTIRKLMMGRVDRKATNDEIFKMKKLVQSEMDAGAIGISTGLYYSPGSYTPTEEIIELSKVVSQNDGIYDSHIRSESSGLISAIKEAIKIGEKAEISVHISHIKCLGTNAWNQSDSIIKIVESAQKKGIKVTANQYPYNASATGLQAAAIPRWAESGGKDSLFIRYNSSELKERILKETKANIISRGGPEKLLIVKSPNDEFVGKNLLEISKQMELEPEVATFKIIEKGYVRVVSFNMIEYDIKNFMKQGWVVTGSDGNTGHPRKYGSFPRKFHKYVKQENVMNTANFINGSTSKTAAILGIEKRGQIKENFFADLIIFNPETFSDVADYKDAFQYSKGLEYSIINGKISVEKGTFTNQHNGVVLKK